MWFCVTSNIRVGQVYPFIGSLQIPTLTHSGVIRCEQIGGSALTISSSSTLSVRSAALSHLQFLSFKVTSSLFSFFPFSSSRALTPSYPHHNTILERISQLISHSTSMASGSLLQTQLINASGRDLHKRGHDSFRLDFMETRKQHDSLNLPSTQLETIFESLISIFDHVEMARADVHKNDNDQSDQSFPCQVSFPDKPHYCRTIPCSICGRRW